MSQPNTTSQKPNPPSRALSNLSRCRYLPRSTPSMSDTATLTLARGDARTAAKAERNAEPDCTAFFFELAMRGSIAGVEGQFAAPGCGCPSCADALKMPPGS